MCGSYWVMLISGRIFAKERFAVVLSFYKKSKVLLSDRDIVSSHIYTHTQKGLF